MLAFNYRHLLRGIPAGTWHFYCQTRRIILSPIGRQATDQELEQALLALPPARLEEIMSELRRVHALANRRGIDALRNIAPPAASLHDDLPNLTSDAERALWIMVNWPELFTTAESFYRVNQRIGKRGWQRLQVQGVAKLYREADDVRTLERTLAMAFTPQRGKPRACAIDVLDRQFDGGVQFSILIEDNAQRQLEFGEDNRLQWRDVRPPLGIDLVVYPASGIIDLLAPGGEKVRQRLLHHLGQIVFRQTLQPQAIRRPLFFLNRLRDGFVNLDPIDTVECIRWSYAKLRATGTDACDYLIKPRGDKQAPDVAACLKAHGVESAMSAFPVVEAMVTLHFHPTIRHKTGRVLHIELKQSGVSNLADLDATDARLAESLLRSLGVMEPQLEEERKQAVPA